MKQSTVILKVLCSVTHLDMAMGLHPLDISRENKTLKKAYFFRASLRENFFRPQLNKSIQVTNETVYKKLNNVTTP